MRERQVFRLQLTGRRSRQVPTPTRDDDGASDRDDRSPSPSARVRLEVELLASDEPAALPAPVLGDRPQRYTVLIVAGDADVRRYVRECLHDRADLHLLEASAVAMAGPLATLHRPDLLIVDARDVAVLSAIAAVRAVLIADDLSSDAPPKGRIVRLMRPFGGQELEASIEVLLSDSSGPMSPAD